MLKKVTISLVLMIFFFSFNVKEESKFNKMDLYLILHDSVGDIINSGFVYVLSNDVIVNDISICLWDNLEKRGLNKIPKNGIYKISKSLIEANNGIKSDSINIIYRCGRDVGNKYKIPIIYDTIHVYNVERCATVSTNH